MKYVFIAWAAPLLLFWGWYILSLNDMHFGYVMLSRAMHDLIFGLYGDILGLDPEIIPGLVARACIVDTLLIGAIWVFRRRRELAAWWRRIWTKYASGSVGTQALEPVQDALKNEGSRSRIDARGAFFSRNVHLDKRSFGRHRGQPLVPEGER